MLAPASAVGSTITGRITGAPIPAEGTGEALVRAVSLLDGRVVAAGETDPAGRYRLTVPKGAYAIFPTVVRPGQLLSTKPTKVRLRSGQRKTVRTPARTSAAVLRRPIVAIRDDAFTGGTGEYAVLNRGIGAMLITDLAGVPPTADCTITVVEVSAAFRAFYRQELDLVRRGLVDPATAIRPGRLIQPTRGIRGRISVTGDRVRIDAEIYKWSNKRTLHRTSVEGPGDSFFALEEALAAKLAAKLCDQPTPISGTFSGSVDLNQVTSLPSDVRLDWTGAVVFEPQANLRATPTVFYTVRSGSFTVNIRGRGEASNCTITGNGSFTLPTVSGGGLTAPPAMSTTEGAVDTYQFFLGAASALTATFSDCQDPAENGKTKTYPLLQFKLLPTGVQTVKTEGVYEGVLSEPGTAIDGAYSWSWSFLG